LSGKTNEDIAKRGFVLSETSEHFSGANEGAEHASPTMTLDGTGAEDAETKQLRSLSGTADDFLDTSSDATTDEK